MDPKVLEEYFSFLRFKSVSTDPQYKQEVLACADWLSHYLQEMGFTVERWETSGHPTLFASHLKAGPNQPTLLLYNHYDVQPVDPIEEWLSPPFEPTVRNGEVFARGAQDNKGQCFYTLQGLKKSSQLPINIKLCIEGEEECGSAGLSRLLQQPEKRQKLKADYLAIVDMGIPDMKTPAVTLGVRGIVTMELVVQGSKGDLHSGSHGGIVFNPVHALVQLLASVRNSEGKITIPGFYDDITPLNPEEKGAITFDFDQAQYEKMFEASPTGGEKEYSPLERAGLRPTFEINGIAGGYAGAGFKTVLPAKAIAKISCRLVPDQDPQKMATIVKKFLENAAPKGVQVSVKILEGKGKAIRANPSSKLVKAFSQAYQELFKKPCQCILDGGSIPIVTQLAEASGGEVILLGLGLPDDNIHAPNEHFGIDRIEMGTELLARTIELLVR